MVATNWLHWTTSKSPREIWSSRTQFPFVVFTWDYDVKILYLWKCPFLLLGALPNGLNSKNVLSITFMSWCCSNCCCPAWVWPMWIMMLCRKKVLFLEIPHEDKPCVWLQSWCKLSNTHRKVERSTGSNQSYSQWMCLVSKPIRDDLSDGDPHTVTVARVTKHH